MLAVDPQTRRGVYRVYRDGALTPLRVVEGRMSTSLVDLALTNGRSHSHRIEAVDVRGNRSGLSTHVSAVPAASPAWGP